MTGWPESAFPQRTEEKHFHLNLSIQILQYHEFVISKFLLILIRYACKHVRGSTCRVDQQPGPGHSLTSFLNPSRNRNRTSIDTVCRSSPIDGRHVWAINTLAEGSRTGFDTNVTCLWGGVIYFFAWCKIIYLSLCAHYGRVWVFEAQTSVAFPLSGSLMNLEMIHMLILEKL